MRSREYAAEIRRILADLATATERHRGHAEATHLKLVAVEVVAEKWLCRDSATSGPPACRPPGHLHRVRDRPPRGRRGAAGLRRLDRLHRPGCQDAARQDAVQIDLHICSRSRYPCYTPLCERESTRPYETPETPDGRLIPTRTERRVADGLRGRGDSTRVRRRGIAWPPAASQRAQ